MAKLYARVQSYLFEEVDPSSLALLRILFGCFLCISCWRLWPWVDLLFAEGGVRYSVLLKSAPAPATARALYGAMLLLALLFTLGVKSRWMARLLVLSFGYHYLLAIAATSAVVDRLTLIFLCISSFAELDGRFALWPERPGGPVLSWAHRMFSLQLCFLYVGAALWKLTYPDWRSGEMLRETLSGSSASALSFALSRLPLPGWLWHALTWSVISAELALGVLYLRRGWAPVAFVLACTFHGSIAVLLDIDEFLICVCVAPAALEPDLVARCLGAIPGTLRASLGRSR